MSDENLAVPLKPLLQLERASTQDDIIPKHILDQFKRRLEHWKNEDQTFVNTKAETQVMKTILTQNCITITGKAGTGKSFLSRHVALNMMKQGYFIIPCDNPADMRQWFTSERKTLFVFDDVCGQYTLNQRLYNEWKQRLDRIESLLTNKYCKVLATCRLEIYNDKRFSSLSIFSMNTFDLSSQNLCLSAAERNAIAQMYVKDDADKIEGVLEKYEFFPLLCSLYYKQNIQQHMQLFNFFSNPFDVYENELNNMCHEDDTGKMKYCSLVLCVMFNNTLKDDNFLSKDKKTRAVIQDLLDAFNLNTSTSTEEFRESLKTVTGTYVVKADDCTYKIVHAKLFDFLAKYLGEKMLQLFIKHAETGFIRERFIWKTTEETDIDNEFLIRIPDELITIYIDRMLRDWDNGYVCNVSRNRNMNCIEFTKSFISRLNELTDEKQEKLARTHDVKNNEIGLLGSCYIGNVDLVKWLISRKSNINYCSYNGWFPLLWASHNGHVNVVTELLNNSAEVNNRSKKGETPLFIASQNGHVDVVNKLLMHSADVNKCDNSGLSPLYIASQNGHIIVVKELLQYSNDVNMCDKSGLSPLYIASQNGHFNAADVNKCDNSGLSPLYIASQYGHIDVVEELLQHSADVNKCDNSGLSPLYIASQYGHIDVVEELLLKSADVNSSNNNGASPLYIASQNGHVNIVQTLLKHSANVNKYKSNGVSPLYIASQNGYVDVVTELLQKSANVNQCDEDKISPLYIASQNGHVNIVQTLLKHSANVNKYKSNGVSPLYIASQNGYVDVVTELLEKSANVNQCDEDNISPLYIACQNGHVNVVTQLVQCTTKVNNRNNNGVSPLYIASYNGHVDVVRKLLENSADVNMCDKDTISPLYVASQNGHVNVVKELLQHSAKLNNSNTVGVSPLYIASQNGHDNVVKELTQYSEDLIIL